ncbi:laminin subunit alpha-1-like [Branchiostoma lanceolatum]|uniref:laminin subunit alpha-1-like n=1 Tax=Branchiostoma lanceolatum TaxID=7740 RepID=UPI003455A1BE
MRFDRFALTCQFRAEAPDGVLVYAENWATKQNYVALYMSGGYLIADMKTLQPDNGAYHNLKVHSKFGKYADGTWWQVTVLRINNFLAIFVPERRDYRNNGQDPGTETLIDLTTPLYVGGTSLTISRHFFIPKGIHTGFAGCIRLLEISATQQIGTFTFDLGSPDYQYNVGQCYEAIHLGTAFISTGYATKGTYVCKPGLDMSVRFSTVQRSFLLLLLFQDAANYFLMDAEDGRIRVHLRKNGITTTIRTTHVETGYEICDGEFHTVVLSFNLSRVGVLFLSIQLDDLPANQFQQTGFDDVNIEGGLYLGGAPAAASLASPDLKQTSFRGCLESLVFNGVTQDFRQTALTEHVTSGCPARP